MTHAPSAGTVAGSLSVCLLCVLCVSVVSPLCAEPPVASYLFPAGGRRGTTVDVHVGGLFLHKDACWELLGPGVALASPHLGPAPTLWFEGPMLPLPESQQAEDYPQGHGRPRHASPPTPPLGIRRGRVWTAAGRRLRPRLSSSATCRKSSSRRSTATRCRSTCSCPSPSTAASSRARTWMCGRFPLHKGQSVACEVCAARLGSPLDSYLEVVGPDGRVIAENDDALGADSFVRFTAAADGKYGVRIRDANGRGGQAFVYRLTLTSDAYVERVFPLGGRRGEADAVHAVRPGRPRRPGRSEAARRRAARLRLAFHRRRRQGCEPRAARPRRPAGSHRERSRTTSRPRRSRRPCRPC